MKGVDIGGPFIDNRATVVPLAPIVDPYPDPRCCCPADASLILLTTPDCCSPAPIRPAEPPLDGPPDIPTAACQVGSVIPLELCLLITMPSSSSLSSSPTPIWMTG